MYKRKKLAGTPGFTIVELLIVIVVIAILAAISIVGYSGIQTRAKNAATEQTVTQYKKALATYVAQYGTYPTPTSSSCMGEVSAYPDGCSINSAANPTFASELKKVASAPPPPVYDCFTGWGGCRRNFEFVYEPTWRVDGDLHPYYIIYFLNGGGKCQSSLEGDFANFSTSKTRGYMEARGSERMCIDALPAP